MMNKLGQLEHIDINPSIYIYIRENTEVHISNGTRFFLSPVTLMVAT